MAEEQDRIPITAVSIGEEEKRRVLEVLDSGWLVQGKQVADFEQRVADYVSLKHGVATTSCTTSLHAAVLGLGLKPGDEVIVPAFTWISTPNVVAHSGATPVFCDVALDTFNLDPAQLDSLVSPKTVGMMPVHLFGLGADMPAVHTFAKKHNLWVVEDAACALGTTINGEPVGKASDAACFSFHPRKSITTGEGGMVVTDDDELAERIRALRNHGASISDMERHRSARGVLLPDFNVLGFNYRMTDLQAAVGHGQLDQLDGWIARRRELAALYREQLTDLDWVQTPPDDPGHSYQSFACLYRPESPSPEKLQSLEARRDALLIELDRRGIVTRQGTHAPVRQGCYHDLFKVRAEDFPGACLAQGLSFALPLFPTMTDGQLERVVQTLKDIGPDAPSP